MNRTRIIDRESIMIDKCWGEYVAKNKIITPLVSFNEFYEHVVKEWGIRLQYTSRGRFNGLKTVDAKKRMLFTLKYA